MSPRYSFKLAVFILLALCGCKEEIIHNLSEHEANRLLTRLHDISVEAQKTKQPDGRWALTVGRDEARRAIKYLSESKAYRDSQPAMLDKPSLVGSREDNHFRFERLLSREIEGTISSMAGVLEARVHLNIPMIDPLLSNIPSRGVGSASVLVVADSGAVINKVEIAALVAGASGIQSEKVNVLIHDSGEALAQAKPAGALVLQTQPRSVWGTIQNSIKANRGIFTQIAIVLIMAGAVLIFRLFTKRGDKFLVRSAPRWP